MESTATATQEKKSSEVQRMEFTVERNDLVEELILLAGVVAVKTTIPILSHVLINAVEGKLLMAASDLEISFRSPAKAVVKTPGSGTVPAKKLLDLVRLLPSGPVTVRALENNWLEITSGKKRYKMVGLSSKDFPQIPEFPKKSIKIPADSIVKAIGKTSYAISNADNRYVLRGALTVFEKDKIKMVTTDGHRMSLTVFGGDFGSEDSRAIVPGGALTHVEAMAKAAAEGVAVEYAFDKSHLFFRVGERVLIASQLTGQFPAYEAVLPTGNDKLCTLGRAELSEAINRVAQMADSSTNVVRFSFSKDGLEVRTQSAEYGEAVEMIDAPYSGEPVVIGFNAKYVADFLAASTAEQVSMEMKDGNSAGEMKVVGEDGDRYIIMPMKT